LSVSPKLKLEPKSRIPPSFNSEPDSILIAGAATSVNEKYCVPLVYIVALTGRLIKSPSLNTSPAATEVNAAILVEILLISIAVDGSAGVSSITTV
jgi:hypothetical protein